MQVPAKPAAAVLAARDPWRLADPRAWQGSVPVASILVALGLGVGGLLAGLYALERMDV
jgi:hypothetical protein